MLASLGSVSGTTQRLDSFFHGSAAIPAQPVQPVDEIALQIVEGRVSLPGLGLMPRQQPGPAAAAFSSSAVTGVRISGVMIPPCGILANILYLNYTISSRKSQGNVS